MSHGLWELLRAEIMRKTIVRTNRVYYEAWSTLKEISRQYDIPYHQLSRRKFPFHFRGWDYIRVNHNQKADQKWRQLKIGIGTIQRCQLSGWPEMQTQDYERICFASCWPALLRRRLRSSWKPSSKNGIFCENCREKSRLFFWQIRPGGATNAKPPRLCCSSAGGVSFFIMWSRSESKI